MTLEQTAVLPYKDQPKKGLFFGPWGKPLTCLRNTQTATLGEYQNSGDEHFFSASSKLK